MEEIYVRSKVRYAVVHYSLYASEEPQSKLWLKKLLT